MRASLLHAASIPACAVQGGRRPKFFRDFMLASVLFTVFSNEFRDAVDNNKTFRMIFMLPKLCLIAKALFSSRYLLDIITRLLRNLDVCYY